LEYVRSQGRSRATLVLEDGAAFEGWSFAGEGEVAGEVVFTTSMVGYQ
jgi:carbamoyl-phosphate synthase small subunit